MSITLVVGGYIISIIGLGYFLYGKKASNFSALISGIAMMIYPYFIENITVLFVTALLLIILPIYIKF